MIFSFAPKNFPEAYQNLILRVAFSTIDYSNQAKKCEQHRIVHLSKIEVALDFDRINPSQHCIVIIFATQTQVYATHFNRSTEYRNATFG